MASMQPHALDQLWATVSSRKGADPASSWTAKLLSKGVNKCAQKVGEEATEVVIEAASGNAAGVVSESADLLYHLEVLWAATGVEPEQVYAELRRREGTSGIAEKAARPSPRRQHLFRRQSPFAPPPDRAGGAYPRLEVPIDEPRPSTAERGIGAPEARVVALDDGDMSRHRRFVRPRRRSAASRRPFSATRGSAST